MENTELKKKTIVKVRTVKLLPNHKNFWQETLSISLTELMEIFILTCNSKSQWCPYQYPKNALEQRIH